MTELNDLKSKELSVQRRICQGTLGWSEKVLGRDRILTVPVGIGFISTGKEEGETL